MTRKNRPPRRRKNSRSSWGWRKRRERRAGRGAAGRAGRRRPVGGRGAVGCGPPCFCRWAWTSAGTNKNDLAVKFCAGPHSLERCVRGHRKKRRKPKQNQRQKPSRSKKRQAPNRGRPRRRQRKIKTKPRALQRHSRTPRNRGRLPRQRPSRMRAAFWGRRARWQRRSGPGGRRF